MISVKIKCTLVIICVMRIISILKNAGIIFDKIFW